jgi:hypothetical protein
MRADDVIARLDLTGCPEGSVLNPWDPDQSIEEQHFRGWEDPLEHPQRVKIPAIQGWQVVTDEGRRVLENMEEANLCLVTGDLLWEDYAVEGRVRMMHAQGYQSKEDPSFTDGQAGLIFRYQHVRRFYFFCIEGYDRLCLYRREHDYWMPLWDRRLPFDRSCYYTLRVWVTGDHIWLYVDGRLVGDIHDDNLATGKAGIWVNTRARFDGVQMRMADEANANYLAARDEQREQLAELQAEYPQGVLERHLAIKDGTLMLALPAHLRNADTWDALLAIKAPGAPGQLLRAITLGGDTLWERRVGTLGPWRAGDMTGDGRDEIACVCDGQIRILEGGSGETRAETAVPPNGPFTAPRGQPALLHQLYIANMAGSKQSADIIVADDYQTVWRYDGDLHLCWERSAFHGHRTCLYDIDGDGRDEALVGFHLLNADGETIWQVEDSEYLMLTHHVDSCGIADLDGDGENEVAIAGSNAGYFLVEGSTGRVLRNHRVGHVQALCIARFCADLSGYQVWAANRWRNYGIMTLFDGEGNELHQFEPNNISQVGGAPVNWRGDGEELLLVYTSPEALGLYDRHGRKVVTFEQTVLVASWRTRPLVYDVAGDGRDEVILYDSTGIYIYTQDRPFVGQSMYRPYRDHGTSDSIAMTSLSRDPRH